MKKQRLKRLLNRYIAAIIAEQKVLLPQTFFANKQAAFAQPSNRKLESLYSGNSSIKKMVAIRKLARAIKARRGQA